MKHILSVLISSLLFSSQVYAWTIDADFEGGVVGAKAEAPNAFTGAFKDTNFTDLIVNSGNRAAEIKINAGSYGFGTEGWGGSWKYPALGQGDELWFRTVVFFPNGFNFSCSGCTQGVKFMRIHTSSPSGSNQGYHSNLIANQFGKGIVIDSEVTGKLFHDNNAGKKRVGVPVTTGTWHSYEMYIKFSSIPGQGIYRAWQDGNLIFEDTVTNTLQTSTSKSDLIYLFGFWNNGSPATQKAYIDDVVVTNERPSNTDSAGNAFIGAGNFVRVAAPNPPILN